MTGFVGLGIMVLSGVLELQVKHAEKLKEVTKGF